jgi:short subunit dehydrogenase-like uncharacterized protein
MPREGDILIAGGYGTVGRHLANSLAPLHPGRVVLAGRTLQAAEAACATVGHGSRARWMNVDDALSVDEALAGVAVVIACVGQHERWLPRAAAARGLAYVDLSPKVGLRDTGHALEHDALRTGARLVLGAGLQPGISSMMARALSDRLGALSRIETFVLLSVGDEYGPDTIAFVLEASQRPFTVHDGGDDRVVRPWSEPAAIRFPPPVGRRLAFLFPFSDVAAYPETLGVRTALGRIALEPAWLGAAIATAGHVSGGWGAGDSLRRRRVVERLQRARRGQDVYALSVRARGARGAGTMTLLGRRQAEAAAIAVTPIVRALYEGSDVPPGVWMPEQVLHAHPFFDELRRNGLQVRYRTSWRAPCLEQPA